MSKINHEVERRPEGQTRTQSEYSMIINDTNRRDISQVVHFTTLRGVIGILADGSLKSRKRLQENQYLQFVFRPNVRIRKDPQWVDYVSLSIERINDWMFDSSSSWHHSQEHPWALLCFAPEILSHEGVVFATTNNIYPSCKRAEGFEGFSRMFNDRVAGRYCKIHTRDGLKDAWPTDRQAEVLYPSEVSCSYLQSIVTQEEEVTDTIHGILGGLGKRVPVFHLSEAFE